jgi:hypothetical protein
MSTWLWATASPTSARFCFNCRDNQSVEVLRTTPAAPVPDALTALARVRPFDIDRLGGLPRLWPQTAGWARDPDDAAGAVRDAGSL